MAFSSLKLFPLSPPLFFALSAGRAFGVFCMRTIRVCVVIRRAESWTCGILEEDLGLASKAECWGSL